MIYEKFLKKQTTHNSTKNKKMDKILEKYKQVSETHSDINEHLITLKKYTEECDTVVEMGVRSIVSTWAFLAGNPKKLISLDLPILKFLNNFEVDFILNI